MELLLKNRKYLRISCSRFSRHKIKTGKNQPPEKCLAINNDHYKRQGKCFPLAGNKVLIRAIEAKLSALLVSQYSPIYLDSGVHFTSMFWYSCVCVSGCCLYFIFFFVKSVNVTKRYWSHRHCQLTRELKKIPAAVIWETRKMISYQRGLNRTQKGRWQGWGLSSVAEHLPNMNEAYKLWGLNLTPSATKNKNLMVPER